LGEKGTTLLEKFKGEEHSGGEEGKTKAVLILVRRGLWAYGISWG